MKFGISYQLNVVRPLHGIIHMPPRHNHPAGVAERIATLDLVSNGRVEFGTGEGATLTEVVSFGTTPAEKKEAWEEATRECLRMMACTPYPGYEGRHFRVPERNVIPKPVQRPHPPVWVAAGRLETAMVGARLGLGALGVGFESLEEMAEGVARYYALIRNCRRPIGVALNLALAAGGNLMLADTDEEAIARGLRGAQYFGIMLVIGDGKRPSPAYQKDRFSLSEASTYFEFVLAEVARAEQQPRS